MEVLTQLLNKLPVSFRFHDRCERVGLTHLVFADDFMIFCATEKNSLKFVRQVLADFTGLSRLLANVGKSSIFVAGVESGEAEELAAFMGFSLSSLPVRYLRLPLLAGRLKAVDCAPLIHRITARIRKLMAQSLSFAGRLQLVRSVLQSFQVEVYVLRGRSLWVVQSEVGRSWYLRVILRCRDSFKHLVHLMIDDGRSCFVWWDPWLLKGAILDSFGFTMVYDAGSNLKAWLSKFLDGEGGWRWPSAFWELLEIWGLI
ncbi:uncharacterized protein LOC120083943 [Benincasa hispida]|uniref:uncharacterized protein LOC120083943 n=1 Tax=Benincasa hispida TaxID=102211 RepID=UPI0019008DC7|nr:uncharacterized protein LOC120083943 [Benincasa hispida]